MITSSLLLLLQTHCACVLVHQTGLSAMQWACRSGIESAACSHRPTSQQQEEEGMSWESFVRCSRVLWVNLEDEEETRRRTSSKRASSQGRERGPGREEKPNSSSAWRSSSRNAGWLRCDARTTNRRELLPTHTATCPAGTSEAAPAPPRPLLNASTAAALSLHRRSICRSHTMWRILLHFPIPP
ncbi:unnamed protein product, partial [Musa hybrid cultivar]